MNRKLWLLMTWLLVVPAFVQAASVRGVVVDYETNKPIANVKVAIRNVSAVTDFDGNFELEKVRAGSVVVVFTAADYKAYSVDFVVNDGVNTLNASLQPKKVGNTLNQQALEDNIFELDESAIDDEGSAASQSASCPALPTMFICKRPVIRIALCVLMCEDMNNGNLLPI